MLDRKLAPITLINRAKYLPAQFNAIMGKDLQVPLTIKAPDGLEYQFNEAIVNVRRSKNIVSTPVIDGKGTVKELVANGDLEFTITLAIVSPEEHNAPFKDGEKLNSDDYPYEEVKKIVDLLNQTSRLEMISDFLKSFDSEVEYVGIVVKSYTVNQETHTNRQVFTIEAISDFDYNLLIEDNKELK